MARQPNAIDFWRGIALLTIFINHIPGNYWGKFTHANYSLSDSADLFVFLAGWSLRLLVGSPGRVKAIWYLVLRVLGRAVQLYAAQIMITMIAIAMLAATATISGNPLILEWHNAAPVFQDPVTAHIGLAALTHHLGYFDILPLYVVLMAVAPVFVLIDRYAPNWLLPLSLALYLVTLAIPVPMPSWPVDGQWFFNPLAWQLVFVLGFVMARQDGIGAVARHYIVPVRWIAIPIVAVSAYVVWNQMWPDPTRVPRPVLFFIADKTYVTPMRVIQFLALVALMSVTYPYIARWARRLVEFSSMLGRNSLYVFCVGSLLSLAGQIVRFVYRGDTLADTAMVVVGIAIMAFTAWLPEWREDVRTRASAQPAPAS